MILWITQNPSLSAGPEKKRSTSCSLTRNPLQSDSLRAFNYVATWKHPRLPSISTMKSDSVPITRHKEKWSLLSALIYSVSSFTVAIVSIKYCPAIHQLFTTRKRCQVWTCPIWRLLHRWFKLLTYYRHLNVNQLNFKLEPDHPTFTDS